MNKKNLLKKLYEINKTNFSMISVKERKEIIRKLYSIHSKLDVLK